MAEIQRSALLPYPTEVVYRLINDVASYPHYMDGCIGAEVLQETEEFMVARLDLYKGGFKYSLTTRNRMQRPSSIVMELVDGPFDKLTGRWTVAALSDEACKVSLNLRFTLSSIVLGMAARAMFNPMADNLVDALVKRAHHIHKK
ncbi:MAG: ribosome-associated toxin RatA of RatAB toxin-antitoxin module [Oceanicoccus sp.]|jgi:ribosome-associated toxin RatA of RatAB toxin-antitoxin module